MEHRPLVKVRLYMDVPLSLRGVPGIGVPPIMRETGVRLFCAAELGNPMKKEARQWDIVQNAEVSWICAIRNLRQTAKS